MSLLMNYNDPRFLEATKIIFDEQFKRDPRLALELDERRKKLMYDDVVYNLSYLLTAIYFSDVKIFEVYALWIYELLCNIMKDLDRDRIMEQMTDHYSIMSEIITSKLEEILSADELQKANEYLSRAIEITKDAVTNVPLSNDFLEGEHTTVRRAYLNALLSGKTKEAHKIIANSIEGGLSIIEIYEEVLTKVMYEIGELWHRNIITVDKEHYATSVTQMVMSQFYDEIFSQPRSGNTLVSCAIGSELHEIGVRMLSDIFEYKGWDTYFLGAALPQAAIIAAIEEHKPNLLALSVTMVPYLKTCKQIVDAVRARYPDILIAVGGQAFLKTDHLWEKWDVDYYSSSAFGLLKWSEEKVK